MKLENKFFFFIFAITLFSFPLFAEEAAKVTDVVECYVYQSERPGTVQPLYVGDTIPADGIIFLPNVKSSVSFNQQGQSVVLEKPGFYSASGAPVNVSNETRAAVTKALKSQAASDPFLAENLTKDAESDLLALQVDDPQNAANTQSSVSPST